jgi:hypothetical protein
MGISKWCRRAQSGSGRVRAGSLSPAIGRIMGVRHWVERPGLRVSPSLPLSNGMAQTVKRLSPFIKHERPTDLRCPNGRTVIFQTTKGLSFSIDKILTRKPTAPRFGRRLKILSDGCLSLEGDTNGS